jgi:hypothetical protein
VLANGAIEILIGEYLDTWTESVSLAEHALECVTDLAADHRLTIVSNTHDPELVPRLVRAFGLHTAVEGPRGAGTSTIYVGPSTALRPSTGLDAVPQIVRSLTGRIGSLGVEQQD